MNTQSPGYMLLGAVRQLFVALFRLLFIILAWCIKMVGIMLAKIGEFVLLKLSRK